jgi:hypothetical protein
MSSVVVIVADVLVHHVFQMAFVEHNHMVKQILTAGADPAFGHSAPDRGTNRANSQAV